MALSTSMPVAISLVCILVVTLLWSLLKWLWINPKRLERILRAQGFQGMSYRFLFGDSKEKARMRLKAWSKPMSFLSNDHISRTQPFYHHIVKQYGKKCFMWNGPIPMVNISEPTLTREVLMKINEFPKPQISSFLKLVSIGLVQLEGDAWAKHRKLLNPAFHIEKLKLMLPAFNASSNDMLKRWEEMASETGLCEIDVYSDLQKLSADAISRAAFGSNYEEGSRIFELITEQLLTVMTILNSTYFPGRRFVPTKQNRRVMHIQREIKSLLMGVIYKRQTAIMSEERPKDDLLGILLESNMKKDDIGMNLEEVIDECKLFYLAGQETTSTLLVWTLIMLSKHQDFQIQARHEVFNTFGNNTPDFHGLNHLNIVTMILQEVLRLYPPVTEVARIVPKDIKVGDIVLPAGVLVNLPILDIHHDEELWGDDAKEFNPKRFSQGISKASKGNMCFFPFGWGPRICIGSNFAMLEAKLALALILQRFSFELSPSYAHAPAAVATLQPQFGAHIILKRL